MNRTWASTILLPAALLLAQAPAFAQGLASMNIFAEPKQGRLDSPILDPECDGNSSQMRRCQERKVQALDTKLNSAYREALKKLSLRDVEAGKPLTVALRKSQRAWLNFKATNCALHAALPMGDGDYTVIYAKLCEEAALTERIEELLKIARHE